MAIKITTDSTCDLPAWLLEKYDITVAPLGIVKGGKLYQDGINISQESIAAHVDAGGELTTTSAVNIEDYRQLFSHALERYDAVVHIDIGQGFSSCYQNARLAAEGLSEVYVVDSRSLSSGQGMLAVSASEAARAGKSPTEIVSLLEELVPKVEASFIIDRLDYMKKGGRCSAVTTLGANLLRLHPCVDVIDGRMTVTKKYRGSLEKATTDYYRDRIVGRTDIDTRRAYIAHTASPEIIAFAQGELEKLHVFDEIVVAKACCTVFSHCGPGTVSAMFLRK